MDSARLAVSKQLPVYKVYSIIWTKFDFTFFKRMWKVQFFIFVGNHNPKAAFSLIHIFVEPTLRHKCLHARGKLCQCGRVRRINRMQEFLMQTTHTLYRFSVFKRRIKGFVSHTFCNVNAFLWYTLFLG